MFVVVFVVFFCTDESYYQLRWFFNIIIVFSLGFFFFVGFVFCKH